MRYNITDDIINEVAQTYNPKFHEAPIVIGHVKNDKMIAYAWVAKTYKNDEGRLAMDAGDVEPQFAEMVKDGRVKKRSVELYHPDNPANPTPGQWHLKHVAFLGAVPPAVKGLKDIKFSEDDGGICLSEPLPPTTSNLNTHQPENQPKKETIQMAEQNTPAAPTTQVQNNEAALQSQIAELQKKLQEETQAKDAALAQLKETQDKLAAIEKEKEQQQTQEIAQFAESMVKQGRMLPKDKAMHVAIMTDLQKANPVQFSEGNTTRTESKLDAYKAMFKAKEPAIQFGEFAPADASANNPDSLNEEALHKRVQAYMATHPDVTYVDALNIVKLGQDKQA